MKNLLVVDDDPLVIATIKSLLERKSYDVVCATSGRQAIELFAAQPFDLVLCDMIMPDIEGLETITRLRQIRPDAVVVAMSGGGRTKNMDFLRMAEKLGAADSIRKPFLGADLIAVIEKNLPQAADVQA